MAALENFCSNLRHVMRDRKLSQQSLADLLHTKQAYISRLLTGGVDPGMKQCQKIADTLDIPLQAMLAEPEEFSKVRA